MARSILRAGKIAGVVIVAIIVVAAVLYSAGVLSIAQTQLPLPDATGEDGPASDAALAEQKELVIACLAGDEPEAAAAAMDKLLADFAQHEQLPETVYEIADSFRKQEKYAKAQDLYQYVVDTWPNDPKAIWSQLELFDIALVDLKDDAQAEVAYETLLERFGGHDEIAEVVVEVARTYRRQKRHADSLRIYRQVPANWPDCDSVLLARRCIVCLLIGLGDAEGADAEVAGLLADYAGDKRMAGVAQQMGDRFYWKKLYERALRLYEYVAGNYAESKEAISAQCKVVTTNLDLENEDGASAALDRLLTDYAEDADFVESVVSVARTYRKEKQFDTAIGIYEFIVDNRPDDPKAIWSQFELFNIALVDLKDDEQAEAAYATLLERFGDHDEIVKVAVEVARTYRRQKRYADSLRIFRRVLANWPDYNSALPARQGIICSLIGLGDIEGADAEVATLLADYAGDKRMARITRGLGDKFYRKKLYERAIRLYEYNETITAQRRLVTANIDLEDEDAAQQALDELTLRFADDPRLSEELYEIGEHYRKRKKYPSARNVYQHVIDDWPGTANAVWSSQRCIVMDIDLLDDPNDPQPQIPGEILQATDDFIAGYGGQKEMVRALLYAGEEYYKRAFRKDPRGLSPEAGVEFKKASAIFAKIITQAPVDAKYTGEAHYLTAVGLSRAGRYEEAIAHHQAVMDNWPKHHLAWSSLYWIGSFQQQLKKQGLLTAAEADAKSEEAFLQLFEEYPDTPMVKAARSQLAMIYYRAKRWEEAVSVYEHIIQEAPLDDKIPKSAFYLARAYEQMGQEEMALQTYREFLEAWPELSSAKYAQTAIEKLGGQD